MKTTKKLDITTIIGIALGLGAVAGAMYFKEVSYSVFNNPAALIVIFVGTAASVMNSFSGHELKNIGKLFNMVFNDVSNGMSEKQTVEMFQSMSLKARKEGLLALEQELNNVNDDFIRKGLRMAIDGMQEEVIVEILESDISEMEERHGSNASIFSSAGAYAPTLGVLGAVFGLIAAMAHIDDIEIMAHAVAAAFIATILGIFTGYVLWNPFANKLKIRTKHEVAKKRLAIVGIISMQRGESPTILRERMVALLPSKDQAAFTGNQS
ncbi:MAG: flagellar motor stator protein MotA [Oscillospiraceae bacterium]|jgi:chemotaxis protein MotA|nr:flagellar motor stator protein MotA [Oscillospiraceae bacterium]